MAKFANKVKLAKMFRMSRLPSFVQIAKMAQLEKNGQKG